MIQVSQVNASCCICQDPARLIGEQSPFTQKILDGALPPDLVVASLDLTKTIAGAKRVAPEEIALIRDWPVYLELESSAELKWMAWRQ